MLSDWAEQQRIPTAKQNGGLVGCYIEQCYMMLARTAVNSGMPANSQLPDGIQWLWHCQASVCSTGKPLNGCAAHSPSKYNPFSICSMKSPRLLFV
jgi:hypothetical protein